MCFAYPCISSVLNSFTYSLDNSYYRSGGWGYSWEFFVGVCRPVPQILNLFQTKECNYRHPFSHQTCKIHTRFQTWP